MAFMPNRSSCCFIDDNDDIFEHLLSKLNRSLVLSMWRSISISSSSGYASSPRGHLEFHFNHRHRQPHFLKSCFLYRKSIVADSNIFMYRGDTPFCNEECRMEHIEMDEAKERHRNVLMKSELQTNSNSNNAEGYSCCTGTVIASMMVTCESIRKNRVGSDWVDVESKKEANGLIQCDIMLEKIFGAPPISIVDAFASADANESQPLIQMHQRL